MILYKYYGFEAGVAALQSSKLGFRKPAYFNDPFELTFLDNTNGDDELSNRWDEKIKGLREVIDVLSLTRAPINPLMWSHYGQDHKGFVIGYEVDTPFLNSVDNCLIPVEQGDVLYTNTKPIHKVTQEQIKHVHELWLGIMVGEEAEALIDQYKLKNLTTKLFLTKHANWVYEEEVRIIKTSTSILETMQEKYADPMRRGRGILKETSPGIKTEIIPGLKIYDYTVDIVEVYLGVRNPFLKTYKKEAFVEQNDLIINKANDEKWEIYSLSVSKGTWGLSVNKETSDIFKVGT